MLVFIEKTGAGEGIRTLDPNLGKRKIASSLHCTRLLRNAFECPRVRGLRRLREFAAGALQRTSVNWRVLR